MTNVRRLLEDYDELQNPFQAYVFFFGGGGWVEFFHTKIRDENLVSLYGDKSGLQ
jgi:hypothetical protein